MIRRAVILSTLFALIIGSIGVPVSLHACSMEGGRATVGTSCLMCGNHAESKGCGVVDPHPAKKKGCCQTKRVLQHIDNARAGSVSLELLVLPAVVHPVYYTDGLLTRHFGSVDLCADLPPPGLALHAARTWLHTSRLLI